jgi:hypothetical protein
MIASSIPWWELKTVQTVTGICIIVNEGTSGYQSVTITDHGIPYYTGMTMRLARNGKGVGRVCCLRGLGSREGGGIPGRVYCRNCVPLKVILAPLWGVHLTK